MELATGPPPAWTCPSMLTVAAAGPHTQPSSPHVARTAAMPALPNPDHERALRIEHDLSNWAALMQITARVPIDHGRSWPEASVRCLAAIELRGRARSRHAETAGLDPFDPKRSLLLLSICTATNTWTRLLDHLVIDGKEVWRPGEAERLGCLASVAMIARPALPPAPRDH